MRINIGCGQTPTPGWKNYDNSLSVRLARVPGITRILALARLRNQLEFAQFARSAGIEWADAVRRIPLANGSADVVYSSHMFEHLHPHDAVSFLRETHRVLRPGGLLRLALPDLATLVRDYLRDLDADAFVSRLLLATPPDHGTIGRLKTLISGHRHHLWMYDGPSLVRLVTRNGFGQAVVLPPGKTQIPDPGELDLAERSDESVYVEATRV
jgi:SAM-dependent methyltransferase